MTEEKIGQILKMAKQGISYTKIAKDLNESYTNVYRYAILNNEGKSLAFTGEVIDNSTYYVYKDDIAIRVGKSRIVVPKKKLASFIRELQDTKDVYGKIKDYC